MIPQPYPLYARIWQDGYTTPELPPDTAAIIGWEREPLDGGGYTPVTVLINTPGRDTAWALDPDDGWRWRITTNPDDTWTPNPVTPRQGGEHP